MCHRSYHNHFHVLEDFSDEERELDETLSDGKCHATLPIFFGDYLAIAMDKRGANDKRNSRGQRGFVSKKCRYININRETSVAAPKHRSNASCNMGQLDMLMILYYRN
jgi:hypothetical protein